MPRAGLALSLVFTALISLALAQDWPQWGGASLRNNTPEGRNIPVAWNVGGFDRKTGRWKKEMAKNIKWVAELGSIAYGTPVVADGRVYVGTNNGAAYLKRYAHSHTANGSRQTDLGCCLCFREADGKFLWQFSAEKLPTGLANDWPLQGILGSPLVEGDRMWLVSNRCEVVCLDTQGFYDGEDDGPEKLEWDRVFVERRRLHDSLDEGDISPAFQAFLELSDCGLPRESGIRVVEEGKSWLIQTKGADLFDLRLEGEELVVYELKPPRFDGERKKRAALPDRLIGQVSTAGIGKTMRVLFAQAGFELPANITPVEDMKSGVWSLAAKVGGIERKFRIRESGSRLLAETVLTTSDTNEADVVWRFDMMKELNVHPHNYSPCSVTAWGDTLFVCTSNGVDESHRDIPHPEAPSFLALDKHTGKVLWTDNSPGDQIMHTQWSSPAVGVLDGVPQVIFAGGDGWLYSFRADRWKDKKPELLWKFDGNDKESVLALGRSGGRSEIVAIPVIHDGLVYFSLGQDPEHGAPPGSLWCIDPTERGDVSPTLAVRADDHRKLLPRRRIQAVDRKLGEAAIPNPNSAVVWHYDHFDQNGDGEFQPNEIYHLSRGSVAIKDGLLFNGDAHGIVHCLDAKTGKVHWTHDQLAMTWGSPLIVDNKVYVADEDGDVTIFGLSARREEAFQKPPDGKGDFEPLAEINMESAVYTTPVVANNVLFIANKTHLFAIEAPK